MLVLLKSKTFWAQFLDSEHIWWQQLLFFSSRCILELKFATHHRAASLSSQDSPQWMYAVLAEQSLNRPDSLQTLPAHQLCFNSAILHNNYISLLKVQ